MDDFQTIDALAGSLFVVSSFYHESLLEATGQTKAQLT